MNGFLIVGVGGAGCHMASYLQKAVGGPAMAVNTDRKSLEKYLLSRQILIGPKTCGGNGATTPARGRRAAEESGEDLVAALADIRRLILVAGLGGGAGTGAAPVLAKLARERGVDVIAAVTLPFAIEQVRREHALYGLRELQRTGVTVLIHDHAAQFDADDQVSMATMLDRSSVGLQKLVADHIASLAMCLHFNPGQAPLVNKRPPTGLP
jgi:cell division protein FtsZ